MVLPRWWNGIHTRLRIWCPKGREGSSPSLGIRYRQLAKRHIAETIVGGGFLDVETWALSAKEARYATNVEIEGSNPLGPVIFTFMREKREKPTVEMCYFRQEKTNEPCVESPTWKLQGAKHKFKCCDAHLAWGIRLSGYPAMVDKYEPADNNNKKSEPDPEDPKSV